MINFFKTLLFASNLLYFPREHLPPPTPPKKQKTNQVTTIPSIYSHCVTQAGHFPSVGLGFLPVRRQESARCPAHACCELYRQSAHRLGAHVKGQQAGGILHPDERPWKITTPDTCPSRSSGHPYKGVQAAEMPTCTQSEFPGPGLAARGTAKPCPAASPHLTAASAQACSHQSQVKRPGSLPGEGSGVSLHQRLGGLGYTSRLAPAP